MQSNTLSVIQDLSTKANLLRTADDNIRSTILNDLAINLNNISESSKNHGIPSPLDEFSINSNSFISNNESSSSKDQLEINQYDNLSQIKNLNAELKGAVRQSLQVFQSASKEFLINEEQSNRTSLIVNELDNLRKNIAEALEESRVSRSSFTSFIDEESEIKELQGVYNKINSLQSEIMQAGRKLIESEQQIVKTDSEHLYLKQQLVKIEEHLGQITELEGCNDDRKAACGCEVW